MTQTSHDIVVVIPVADRPRHLSDCLNSLLELMRRYPYGGKVTVLLVEDSCMPENMAAHRNIAAEVASQGLDTYYLSEEEQQGLVRALNPDVRQRLIGVIGDGTVWAHKGASITRNIAYLWLSSLQADGVKRLFWFIDSDQEFRVNVATATGEETVYDIDYCNWLDRIFTLTPVCILTGKVVGDPPVSPAVMAGNFLDDVEAFVVEMATCEPYAACSFHTGPSRHADDAAYHDMSELFGFKTTGAFRYHCTLSGSHDHVACFSDFAGKMARFFDGEHPTRRSYYQPVEMLSSVRAARTIYTGNYVFTPEGLDYFIPFAALRLRMAGPTLGRILKAELGARFVSANTPMLHRRTVEAIGRAEFRAGIEHDAELVDLSGEFERQYFGDVMLFSMERLAEAGYLNAGHDAAAIGAMVREVEVQMHAKYRAKHEQVVAKIARLRSLINKPESWWQQNSSALTGRSLLERFIANMQHNFGDTSSAWELINSETHRQRRIGTITVAIGRYGAEREAWREAMAIMRSQPV